MPEGAMRSFTVCDAYRYFITLRTRSRRKYSIPMEALYLHWYL